MTINSSSLWFTFYLLNAVRNFISKSRTEWSANSYNVLNSFHLWHHILYYLGVCNEWTNFKLFTCVFSSNVFILTLVCVYCSVRADSLSKTRVFTSDGNLTNNRSYQQHTLYRQHLFIIVFLNAMCKSIYFIHGYCDAWD